MAESGRRRVGRVRASAAMFAALAVIISSCATTADEHATAPTPGSAGQAAEIRSTAPPISATPAQPATVPTTTALTVTAPTTTSPTATEAPAGAVTPPGSSPPPGGSGATPDPNGDDTSSIPAVDAAAFAVVDLTSGRWLANHAADEQRPVASLVKLLTALVVLDAGSPEHIVTVPAMQLGEGESRIWLYEGQQERRDRLLEAALVVSANDAVVALARDVAGSEAAFVDRMNAAAASLGMDATTAANPVGLDAEGGVSTVRDLVTLTTVLLADPWFRSTVGVRSVEMFGQTFENTNALLATYPGAFGVKTGSTTRAGSNVIAAAERDGRAVLVVVLGASSTSARFESAATLLDWGFAQP